MSIIDSILEAKAVMLNNGVSEPITIRVTNGTLQKILADKDTPKYLVTIPGGVKSYEIHGMKIEVDNDDKEDILRYGDSYRSTHYHKMNDSQKAHFDGLEKHFEKELKKMHKRIADYLLN